MSPVNPVLPIDSFLPSIVDSLKSNPNLVLIAEPGAGKSTRVPPALIQAFKGEFICLQPRRIAARLCAERVAFEMNVKLGAEVGYHIRFENRTSSATRICFVTEALLTRYLLNDPELKNVAGIILDEFHERSIHTDIALALLRELQESFRPDLKIIVMSATLDPEPIASFLNSAEILRVPGRTYPIEKRYVPKTPELFHKSELQTWIRKGLESTSECEGHTLVFLPGKKEIDWAIEAANQDHPRTLTFPLHSSLSPREQQQAIEPSNEKKIIFATNIAETSVTLDGVRTVIDTGLARMVRCDPQLGLDRLELGAISRAAADQRAGRAGRQAPGVCIRLWSEADQTQRRAFEVPEILRADLSHTLLFLAEWGVTDFDEFRWFQKPPSSLLTRSLETLRSLGALDSKNGLTERGRQLSRLSLHPRLGTLFLESKKMGFEKWGAVHALLLNDEKLSARYFSDVERSSNSSHSRFQSQLKALTRESMGPQPSLSQMSELLLKTYPDRLTRRKSEGSEVGIMMGGRAIALAPGHPTQHSKAALWISIDPREIKRAGKNQTLVSLVHETDIDSIRKVYPDEVKQVETVYYDEEQERVIAERALGFRGLALEPGKRVPGNADLLANALFEHFRDQAKILVLKSPQCLGFFERVAFLEKYAPEKGWSSQLLDDLFEKALRSACLNARSKKDLENTDFYPFLAGALSYDQNKELDQNAPERITLPGNRTTRMTYQNGVALLEVKLQHLFGWSEAPKLAYGRAKIQLHLLSPGHRPVQITEDLMSFWQKGYPEVRKELRARYPKHPWPEDPKALISES